MRADAALPHPPKEVESPNGPAQPALQPEEDPRPILFVENAEQLAEAVVLLTNHPALAVDTESNSLYAFQERVCVLQMATKTHLFIVDPIACPELAPLAGVFADETVVKIFHGADYDIMCLKRDFNFEIRNVFDSYVASRMLGHTKLGLADMVRNTAGVSLSKKHTKSDWGKRPLSADQVDYLVDDVRYLHGIFEALAQEMKDKDREEEIQKCFIKLESLTPMRNEPNPDDFWKMKHTLDLSPQSLGALKALSAMRLERARKLDRPVFKVLGNETLISIARELPQTPVDLSRIKGVSPRMQRALGGQILRAVRTGAKTPLKRPPRPPGKFRRRRGDEEIGPLEAPEQTQTPETE